MNLPPLWKSIEDSCYVKLTLMRMEDDVYQFNDIRDVDGAVFIHVAVVEEELARGIIAQQFGNHKGSICNIYPAIIVGVYP